MIPWLVVSSDSEFSIHNLPFGVVSFHEDPDKICATRIGEFVIDLGVLEESGLLPTVNVFEHQSTINAFLEQSPSVWSSTRQRLQALLMDGGDDSLKHNVALRKAAIHDVQSVNAYHIPIHVGDYTDFYSSRYHAETVSELFRGNRSLTTQWKRLPVAYHGRASTVFGTGTPIHRPCGQVAAGENNTSSAYQATAQLDYELEVAAVLGGKGSETRVFGLVLMNDWSARDLQRFEYVPLGPFTGKNFATTISPWVVMTEALATVPRIELPDDPLDYLQSHDTGHIFDIELTATIETPKTKAVLTKTNYKYLFWTPNQQLAHHSVSGCIMRPGDLLGSGTISGPNGAGGSLLELNKNGATPLNIGADEKRSFLEDGDAVVLRGVSRRPDGNLVGFGDCRGTILPVTNSAVESSETTPDRYGNFILYGWHTSSATWRVRTALAAKDLPFVEVPVNIRADEQKKPEFLAKNSLGQVPVLEMTRTSDGTVVHLAQSLAIARFLDDAFPNTKQLWPKDPLLSALATEIVEIVNSGTQPLQNVSYLSVLESTSNGTLSGFELGQSANRKGLGALEKRICGLKRIGPFCLGTFSPTIADICIVPQLHNARHRYQLDVDTLFPTLSEVESHCAKHPWFVKAKPAT